MTDFTIVATYNDSLSFVEWVSADGPDKAIKALESVRGPDDTDWYPVAIFEGHLNDLTGQVGATPLESPPDMLAALHDGLAAAETVVACWGKGDLAGAINVLEGWVDVTRSDLATINAAA